MANPYDLASPGVFNFEGSDSTGTTGPRPRAPRIRRSQRPMLPPDAQGVVDDLERDFQLFLRHVEVTHRPSTIRWYTHAVTVLRLYIEDVEGATAESIEARIRDLGLRAAGGARNRHLLNDGDDPLDALRGELGVGEVLLQLREDPRPDAGINGLANRAENEGEEVA